MLDLGRTYLQSVERSPNALAIVDGELTLTYAQWHRIIVPKACANWVSRAGTGCS